MQKIYGASILRDAESTSVFSNNNDATHKRWRFGVKEFILVALAAFIVVTLFLTLFYRQNMDSAIRIIDEKNAEIEKNIINNIVASLKNVSIHLSIIANLPIDETTKEGREAILRIMWEQLNSNESLASVFIGYQNGNFLQARRAPENAVRATEYSAKSDIWLYKDQNYSTISKKNIALDFDPRTRGWYKNADKAGSFYWSDPYVFASTGAVGITTSLAGIDDKGEKLKVAAADFTLEALDLTLRENAKKAAAEIAIVSANGDIVSSSFAKNAKDGGNQSVKIGDIQDDRIQKIFSSVKSGALRGEIVDDKTKIAYLYSAVKFPKNFGKEWYIVTFLNKNDATVDVRKGLYTAIAEIFAILTAIAMATVYWTIKNHKIKTELANSNLLMKTLLDSLPNPIFYKDKEGRFLGFNKAYEKAFDVNSGSLLGKKVMDLEYLPLEDRASYDAEDTATIKNSGSIVREQTMTFSDGKERHTVYSVNGFKNSRGDPGGLIGVFTDITEQKKITAELKETKQRVEALYKQMEESIEYASFIQHTLLPSNSVFRKYFSEYFVIWRPKNIVGGDIYFFEELQEGEKAILVVADCTGHGVHGAFLTMFVKALERQLLSGLKYDFNPISPAAMLSFFNKNMKKLLLQEEGDAISNVGFDGAILYYDKAEKIVRFAGARTNLFYSDDKEIKTIKGDKVSIGYKNSDSLKEFTDYVIPVKEGMSFYVTTDGYIDQNGGGKGFPFGKTRFLNIIKENLDETMADQQEVFLDELAKYQQNEPRNDDITLIGFRI